MSLLTKALLSLTVICGILKSCSSFPIRRDYIVQLENDIVKKWRDDESDNAEVVENMMLERNSRNNGMKMSSTEFLEKFGYLNRGRGNRLNSQDHSLQEMHQAVSHFQRMYNMPMTGVMDSATMEAMAKPRCGMADMIPPQRMNPAMGESEKTQLRAENYFVPGYKWNRLNLTWNLQNFFPSSEISQETQRQAIIKATKLWSDVSGLSFSEISNTGADLKLRFAGGDHGDGNNNAFDGPSGVLAHAFYPDSGETHFDSAERWTENTVEGINLFLVAGHELGHALGLGHSEVAGSLMAPYYQGYQANYVLPSDDQNAIQSLYGPNTGDKRSVTTTQAPPPPTDRTPHRPPTSRPDTCTVSFRAITQTHDYRIYIFHGDWLWRASDYGLDENYPVLISSVYPNAPNDIEAALFTYKNYYTFLFKNKEIWWYYGYQLVDHKTVTTPGYPSSIQAVVADTDGTIYIMQGGNCWIFDEMSVDIAESTPTRCSNIFPGSPSNFESAVRLFNDDSIYFFQNRLYYKYSQSQRRVVHGYPKPKAGPWFGPACRARPFTPK